MTVWDALKVELTRILSDQPDALASWPDPTVDHDRNPPFRIHLAVWAVAAARDLHTAFGADVELVVGALRYPHRTLWLPQPEVETDVTACSPSELIVELSEPLRVRSGHTLHSALRCTNRTQADLVIVTTGSLTGLIVHSRTGRVVGVFSGAQVLPLVPFRVVPATTVEIPLLVGTASVVPELGYAVPAGRWGVRTILRLKDGRVWRPRDLAVEVIDGSEAL